MPGFFFVNHAEPNAAGESLISRQTEVTLCIDRVHHE